MCVKRDAGDAQAVASWKKSFVRSSTGDDDATSTTVAASAAGGTRSVLAATSTAAARPDGESTARRRTRDRTSRPRAVAATRASDDAESGRQG